MALIVFVFILVTEGKYFGKPLIRWIYNRQSLALELRDDWTYWEHLIQHLDISLDEKLLDLGTQTGHLPRLVARQRGFRGQIVGIDWSEEMIIEARRQSHLEGTASRVKFLCQDVRNPLPFADDSFTLVTCVTGLLKGLKTPESLFQEIQRLLTVNGRVALRIELQPLRSSLIRNEAWLNRHLEPLGFTFVKTQSWTPTRTITIYQLSNK
ncbi:MAG: class I SAM-dependent methyltransferase [Candidatus Hermodarchaeota archaeon]|nr:class I SAM-dependent methyltransferase [Candidatus Hermodarchaeota archaeon]